MAEVSYLFKGDGLPGGVRTPPYAGWTRIQAWMQNSSSLQGAKSNAARLAEELDFEILLPLEGTVPVLLHQAATSGRVLKEVAIAGTQRNVEFLRVTYRNAVVTRYNISRFGDVVSIGMNAESRAVRNGAPPR